MSRRARGGYSRREGPVSQPATTHRLGIEQLGQLHPWLPAQLALGRPLEWLWAFDLPAAPADVWRIVGDTERTNRATGLTSLRYHEQGGELIGSHVTAGVRHEFVERWQWVGETSIELVREFSAGFARVLRNIYRFEPGPGGRGTRLHVYYGWIARGAIGPLVVRVGMRFYERRFRAMVDRVRAAMSAPAAAPVDAAPAARRVDGLAAAAAVLHQPGHRFDPER
ncbi:MAG TPA: SRPBCC family protein, partial [Kofleriaceae bacterium]|nr:SRPBCC family protein [Kofleriaceae bacterium]